MNLYTVKWIVLSFFSIFSFPRLIYSQTTKLNIDNIRFISKGDTLSGTIVKPGYYTAAVVLVHGSGQEKRMLDFAKKVAEHGIAVFTYDKRGVGMSGGIYAGPEVGSNNVDSSNLNLLSIDASEATNVLLSNISSDKIPIGLIGFSQAGFIVPLTAKMNNKVNFMVLFSGPVITAKEQLRFQFYTNGNPVFWDTHTENDAREHILNDPDRYQFIDTDPTTALSQLSIPGLWIFGGKDIQIPIRLSIEHIDSLNVTNKRYQYIVFPSLGHNTSSSNSKEPIALALKWIKNIH